MHARSRLGIAFVLILLTTPPVHAEDAGADAGPPPHRASPAVRFSAQEFTKLDAKNSFAQRALKTFIAEVVTQDNATDLGFDPSDQLSLAKIGVPFSDSMIFLDELRDYKVGDDPQSLVHGGRQIVFPVLIGTQVRSSFTVANVVKDGEPPVWKTVSFGYPGFIRDVDQARANLKTKFQVQPMDSLIVRVRALNVDFLGFHDKKTKDFMLVPLRSHQLFHFTAGEAMKASDAFLNMVPVAKRQTGDPT